MRYIVVFHRGGVRPDLASKAELRRQWLKERWQERQSDEANNHRTTLNQWYSEEAAAKIEYTEAFEICDYGHQPTPAEIRKLFPFLPD
jgi:hypothetical protein